MIATETPYVLLDDARRSGAAAARLYTHPIESIAAHSLDEVEGILENVREASQRGLHAAGFLSYEAGAALLPHLPTPPASDLPLAWFGLFEKYQSVDADVMPSLLPNGAGAWLSKLRPQITRADYAKSFAAVLDYIAAGDIYQANLTFPLEADLVGDPLALYAALRARALAGYGGVVWTGEHHLLSFSPELFFSLKDRAVTTRPMKGTAVRHADAAMDKAAADELREDPKQRAENLMIVDLLRNDLSRICKAGSVEVPRLFHVESYPTVHQMTSTVIGTLPESADAIDVIKALFPCGSITGAPKIRAMQIIDEIETGPRGAYCGSIGRIDANGDAAFNVAIRTFTVRAGEQGAAAKRVSLGLGSGLVADSVESSEWAECLAKGDFARMQGYGFDLIETMRFEPATGIIRLELHLERMKESARVLGFEFDRHAARNQLHAATFHLDADSKIRLLLSRSGAIAIEIRDAPQSDDAPWQVSTACLPVAPDDYRLTHKTSDRRFYDDARNASSAHEVVFTDADGYLTEGSFTSIFVERDGQLLTPPLSRGLLPSVLRCELIESGRAIEADLTIVDLDGGFSIGNSLRGLIAARLA